VAHARSNIIGCALAIAAGAYLHAGPVGLAAQEPATDLSAQSRQQVQSRQGQTGRAARQRMPTQQPDTRARGWRPADPSFDQYGRPYRPPPGLDCPIDLGYGRWASCNSTL
jgi:hypothetical protein